MIPPPSGGGGTAHAVTEGEDGGTLTRVRAAVLPLHHSAEAERSPPLAGEE